MMEQYGKAAIVHPTGTGKSYIAFKLIEDNPEKVVIWLSPSEYIFKTSWVLKIYSLGESQITTFSGLSSISLNAI